MIKTLGLAITLLLAFTLSAAADDVTGTIVSFDPANQSFTLDDGTQLFMSGSQPANVSPGDKVLVTYELQGGKKVVVEVKTRPTIGGVWEAVQEAD